MLSLAQPSVQQSNDLIEEEREQEEQKTSFDDREVDILPLSPCVLSPSRVMTPIFVRQLSWCFPLPQLMHIVLKIRAFVQENNDFVLRYNPMVGWERTESVYSIHVHLIKSICPFDTEEEEPWSSPCQISIEVYASKSSNQAIVEINRIMGTSPLYRCFRHALRDYLDSSSMMSTNISDYISPLYKLRFFSGLVTDSLSPMGRGLVTDSLSPMGRGLVTDCLSPMGRGLVTDCLSPMGRGLVEGERRPSESERPNRHSCT